MGIGSLWQGAKKAYKAVDNVVVQIPGVPWLRRQRGKLLPVAAALTTFGVFSDANGDLEAFNFGAQGEEPEIMAWVSQSGIVIFTVAFTAGHIAKACGRLPAWAAKHLKRADVVVETTIKANLAAQVVYNNAMAAYDLSIQERPVFFGLLGDYRQRPEGHAQVKNDPAQMGIVGGTLAISSGVFLIILHKKIKQLTNGDVANTAGEEYTTGFEASKAMWDAFDAAGLGGTAFSLWLQAFLNVPLGPTATLLMTDLPALVGLAPHILKKYISPEQYEELQESIERGKTNIAVCVYGQIVTFVITGAALQKTYFKVPLPALIVAGMANPIIAYLGSEPPKEETLPTTQPKTEKADPQAPPSPSRSSSGTGSENGEGPHSTGSSEGVVTLVMGPDGQPIHLPKGNDVDGIEMSELPAVVGGDGTTGSHTSSEDGSPPRTPTRTTSSSPERSNGNGLPESPGSEGAASVAVTTQIVAVTKGSTGAQLTAEEREGMVEIPLDVTPPANMQAVVIVHTGSSPPRDSKTTSRVLGWIKGLSPQRPAAADAGTRLMVPASPELEEGGRREFFALAEPQPRPADDKLDTPRRSLLGEDQLTQQEQGEAHPVPAPSPAKLALHG